MKNLSLNFKKGNGLIPAIIQDKKTREIYMLGYMNKEALKKTLETGYVYFWSRSRKKLWLKGKNSGNKLKAENIFYDCDLDTLLISVTFTGNACHTGNKTCFFKNLSFKNEYR